jgi:hypothetical protein
MISLRDKYPARYTSIAARIGTIPGGFSYFDPEKFPGKYCTDITRIPLSAEYYALVAAHDAKKIEFDRKERELLKLSLEIHEMERESDRHQLKEFSDYYESLKFDGADKLTSSSDLKLLTLDQLTYLTYKLKGCEFFDKAAYTKEELISYLQYTSCKYCKKFGHHVSSCPILAQKGRRPYQQQRGSFATEHIMFRARFCIPHSGFTSGH